MNLAIRGTLIAVGLWLVLAPVAVYLVASDDPRLRGLNMNFKPNWISRGSPGHWNSS